MSQPDPPDGGALLLPLYGASPWQATKRFWLKYATFTGRASRSEFWWWTLISLIVSVALGLAGAALSPGGWMATATGPRMEDVPADLWTVVTLCPSIAVTIRRLHDAGRSGWFYVLCVPGDAVSLFSIVRPDAFVPAGLSGGLSPTLVLQGVVGLIVGVGGLIVLVLCIEGPSPAGARFDRR
ncbi:uncharacterized membrane protein YhaH (DUF805 family) [Friedmanniella endophytica]|uniref:Uncharacterized membrane protein YhaH (DUF805 family) n=1 Tax=Microlunatus kandeliicorticis TaxID=1759536 RepID=A0A7W3P7N9_9ACTN|nr:DUF805 domain-containing protein [Microlunatus kandeliicorticis]MBA8796214.1 uncharacterized membrane protein YhaH (DUF805 family) [Microlunatus kandeliicorticis]